MYINIEKNEKFTKYNLVNFLQSFVFDCFSLSKKELTEGDLNLLTYGLGPYVNNLEEIIETINFVLKNFPNILEIKIRLISVIEEKILIA